MSTPADMATAGNCGLPVDVSNPDPDPPSTSPQPSAQLGPKLSSSYPSSPTQHSLKSVKSVDEVHAIGAFPLGSLRIQETKEHEPPPTPLTVPDIPMDLTTSASAPLRGRDVIMFDDLPATFTIGCDTISFTTTQPFSGFRDLPPGPHLFWVAPSEATSSRSGFWVISPENEETVPGKVYVKQWDSFNEVLSDPASQAEERFQMEKLDKIFDSLSPYQLRADTSAALQRKVPQQDSTESLPFLDQSTIWYQLTFGIRSGLLDRIIGKGRDSWPVTSTDRVAGETNLAAEARLYANATSELKFLFSMDARLVNPMSEGAERTRQALDPTGFIIDTLENETPTSDPDRQPEDLVGELQFTFLTAMHLGNFSCMEQWWFLVTRLIFRSYDLPTRRPLLARHLVQTFHAQLVYNGRYLEGDVLDMMPENAAKLQRALTTYKARLNEGLLSLGDRCSPDQNAVGAAFASLESFLWTRGWDLRGDYVRAGHVMLEDGELVQAELSDFEDEDERGEFAPMIVEMEEGGGREAGLVSWDR
ncbi:hypothetical protein F4778DRAFT_725326 [Xylariomycetidae sp. FL2044]|nr:hypothetical protein F4778DRAFT_725326 [Xylariomycetidae sp. FL2044]